MIRKALFSSAMAAALGMMSIIGTPKLAAGATPHAAVWLAIPNNSVTAGRAFPLAYSALRMPVHSSLYLELQEGSAGVWQPVKKLWGPVKQVTSRHGRAVAPGVAMGRQLYRLLITTKYGASSASHVVFSYGNVPLGTLASNSYNCLTGGAECQTGTVQIGTSEFNYVLASVDYAVYPQYEQELSESSSTCRSITVQFGSPADGNANDSIEVEVVRADAAQQTSTIPLGEVGTFTARLDSRAWALDISNGGQYYGYLNGSLSCYTPNGV